MWQFNSLPIRCHPPHHPRCWELTGLPQRSFENIKHLTRDLQAQIKDHLVLTPRLLRIIMQSERSNTPPTDQEVKLQVRIYYFYFLPNPTETQIHSVFKLMSLQPSTATCLAPNSFLSSFEWSFSCSLKHFFVDHSFLCSVSTWDILEMFGLECPGSK